MRQYGNVAVVALVAVAASCATGGSDWEGSVTDSAGVTIVTNTEQGTWGDGDAWTLVEELKIGTLDDPDYQFAQIGFIAVGSDGTLYVLDAQAQQIQVYSAEGTYQKTIGRPGAGPGELGQGAAFIVMGQGDTLLVPDLANRRVNLYDAGGESLTSFPLSLEQGLPMLWRATTAGVVARQSRPLGLPGSAEGDSMDVVTALNMDGSIRDTLIAFRSGGTINLGGGTPQLKLFAAEPVWTMNDNLSVFYGVNDEYRIGIYDSGALTGIIAMPFEPRTVTERDQETVLDGLMEFARRSGAPPAQLQGLRSIITFGETFPAFAALQVGPGGTLWVQHIRDISSMSDAELANFNLLEDTGAADWDVFDADGRYLGVVTMPDRFSPRLFMGDKLYGVWRDDLDVQYVVRLKIDQPSETD